MRRVAYAFRAIFVLAACVLAGIVFVQNGYYWAVELHSDPVTMRIAIVVSVLAGLTKIGVPAYLTIARMRWRHNGHVAVVWLAALAFDLWSSAGYSSLQRATATSETHSTATMRAMLEKEIDDKEDALAKVPATTRAADVIRSELPAAKTRAWGGNCDSRWRSEQDVCKHLSTLQTELANADTRDRLADELTPLRRQIGSLPAPRDAEPQIATVAKWLRSMGLLISDAGAGNAWTIILLLFLELGPVALVQLALAPLPSEPVALMRAKRPPALGPQPAGGSAASRRRPAVQPAARDVLALLRTVRTGPDGWTDWTTQEAIGDQLGVSKTEANRQIKALRASGVVLAETSRRGTRLKLVTGHSSVVLLRP